MVFARLAQELAQADAETLDAAGTVLDFRLEIIVLCLARQIGQRTVELRQRRMERVLDGIGTGQAQFLAPAKSQACFESGEKRLALAFDGGDLLDEVALAQELKQSLPGARIVEPVQKPASGAVGNLKSEMACRDVFERVRFVEDDEVVGVDEALFVLQIVVFGTREEIKKERVVDHDNAGLLGLLAGLLIETTRVVAAGARGALVRLAAHLAPDLEIGWRVEIRKRAVLGRLAPFPDALEFVNLGIDEEITRLLHGPFEPVRAEVILPPFEQDAGEFLRDELLDNRQILVKELLLKIDRVGGDDGLAVVLQRKKHRRDEVSETLANAGARFDQKMRFAIQCVRHGGGHLLLLGAVFEILRAGHDPAGRKHFVYGLFERGGETVKRGDHLEGKQ